MYNTIIIRNGEIAIKGENRAVFEKKLMTNIKASLRGLNGYKVHRGDGRIYIDLYEDILDYVVNRLKYVFGVVSFSPALRFKGDYNEFKLKCLELYEFENRLEEHSTLGVKIKRVDKSFHIKSPDMTKDIINFIRENTKKTFEVNQKGATLNIYGEYRGENNIIYSQKISGLGGLPVGINGKVISLLSGGIDSPVATYMASKRGLSVEAVHFHSFPFTSEKSMQKVEDLAKVVSLYSGNIKIYKVNLLKIQREISEKCPQELMTILSRRFMMRIAEKLAIMKDANALVTGESIGQVASQTLEGLTATNEVVKEKVVIRPLISFDKEDVIKIAKSIKTYDISIIREEDCCTVFLPKKPATKPRLQKIYEAEKNLDIDFLVNLAIEEMEEISIE